MLFYNPLFYFHSFRESWWSTLDVQGPMMNMRHQLKLGETWHEWEPRYTEHETGNLGQLYMRCPFVHILTNPELCWFTESSFKCFLTREPKSLSSGNGECRCQKGVSELRSPGAVLPRPLPSTFSLWGLYETSRGPSKRGTNILHSWGQT